MSKIIYCFSFFAVSFIFIKHTLHMFQQNRYELTRYTKWLFSFKPFFIELSITYICLMIICIFIPRYYGHVLCILISLLFAALFIYNETNKKYVKPLVYTARIKRTLILFVVLFIVIVYLLLGKFSEKISIVGIISIILPSLLIYFVALLLKPLEYIIKKRYENEARSILNKHTDLIKIGITGSYGKTSTKNIVSQILNDTYYTLQTPLSYNTPMGITKTIRENLKNTHEVFVCEMGADHIGDITYLMNMVKPKYGIVSSIGPQHLNTFMSIDNIVREKMREIEMLPEDGVGIINLDNEYIANYPIKNICKVISVGINNQNSDYLAKNISYLKDGTSFTVEIKNEEYKFETSLLGEHNILNILLAIALSVELKIDPNKIVEAVRNLKPIEHRLEVKKINGYSFIDDAFNSNPSGSLYALKALSMMPNKRVIVTPGLIDLGEQENRANYDFGKNMYGLVDFVILVGKSQTKYIYKGLSDVNFNLENVVILDSIYEAFTYVYEHFSKEDTILLENDLPDAFNN